MKHVVYKVFFLWDFEKEEKWLNEMAAKGLMLTDVGFCRYVFEEGTPGEYQYHLGWLPHFPGHAESRAYIRFVEDTGAEHVGSFKKWVYFRKKTAEGPFNLYSDLDSRISHFRRVTGLTAAICSIMAVYILSLIVHCLRLGYIPQSYIPIFVTNGSLLAVLCHGLYRGLGAYRTLKRKRIIQE